WLCLRAPNIQEKLIDLIQDQHDTGWQNWWRDKGREKLRQMYQWTLAQPQSEEAEALSAIADKIMSKLCDRLTVDQQWSDWWVIYWDQLLHSISKPSTDVMLWSTLPRRLSNLRYNNTYQSWWEQSGKQMAKDLYQIAITNSRLDETTKLTENLGIWFQTS